MIETFRCYRCKEDKPQGEFARNKSKPRGVDDECRTCKNEYKRLWSAKHKDKRLITKTKWRKSHPESDQAWNRIRRERRAQAKNIIVGMIVMMLLASTTQAAQIKYPAARARI